MLISSPFLSFDRTLLSFYRGFVRSSPYDSLDLSLLFFPSPFLTFFFIRPFYDDGDLGPTSLSLGALKYHLTFWIVFCSGFSFFCPGGSLSRGVRPPPFPPSFHALFLNAVSQTFFFHSFFSSPPLRRPTSLFELKGIDLSVAVEVFKPPFCFLPPFRSDLLAFVCFVLFSDVG